MPTAASGPTRSITSTSWDRPRRRAIVVGGSLAGLCAALALSASGWEVTILEQSTQPPAGMGMSIDVALLSAVTGLDMRALPVIETGFPATGWGLLRQALADAVERQPRIDLREGVRALAVVDGQTDVVVETNAGMHRAEFVVGADGYASTVRRLVSPEEPHAEYGGVVLWRGLVDESDIPGGFTTRDIGFAFRPAGTQMLATYVIPGARGELDPGHRRGVFISFDCSRDALLRRDGYVNGTVVKATVHGSGLSRTEIEDLHHETRQWPAPWGRAAAIAVRERAFIGTPIAEFLPSRLVRGRVAILGDAAHSVSPITGGGFHNGLLDVASLVSALDETPDVTRALRRYEEHRLAPVRALVTRSRAWSRSFVRSDPCG
ncbi:2-polyprenyl-6-methoxyphenol hydroxylase-like FAD-dependent oxidoreductase [Glaciihabitans tibetensis]|uniref:2-polyprenyl-6-methoxyphenol hydroxylase-like FAD-dependent oxidoreductase n=1 Tax=Glaciihabitans tibetensis TaxID=1266600 RepID=A0A2T0V6T5_9MICO|nr:FAD-dependent monooxygenase [Glaciihabitans tibetensis]PRY65886.1 2-polyprenyl-6-methoxyphenol hydroxylase-like FAD-dependent oxidoreductase [Glaciihabitans tibetensis]